jgi:hypothetical protein
MDNELWEKEIPSYGKCINNMHEKFRKYGNEIKVVVKKYNILKFIFWKVSLLSLYITFKIKFL